MKNVNKKIIFGLIGTVIIYLLGCFVAVSFDLNQWHKAGRTLAMCTMALLYIFLIASELKSDSKG